MSFAVLLAFDFNRDKILCAFFVYVMVEGPQRGTVFWGGRRIILIGPL
jgi:hypothetical protein